LPEAQLDRFLIQLNLGYPDFETEVDILYAQAETHPLDSLQPVLTEPELLAMQAGVRSVHVEKSVARYIVRLVQATREDGRLRLGVSPRGALMLFRASQAAAYASGREHVLPDDVQRLAPFVLSHRIVLTSKVKYGSVTKQQIIIEIIDRVTVPT